MTTHLSISMRDLRQFSIAHLDQYFGLWSCHEPEFRALIGAVDRLDMQAHAQQQLPLQNQNSDLYETTQAGIAVVQLSGVLTKFGSSFNENGSTLRARAAIRAALRDDTISGILIHIDSPGGTTAGTKELADDFFNAGLQKATRAFIEDMGASAAFYVASQAQQVAANGPAFVGGMGTFMAIADLSRAAEQQGIVVHVIRAGAFKGAGTPGTEITEAHLAEFQRLVNAQNDFFVSAVARGRELRSERVLELADGRVHLAADAVTLGLIDRVASLDEVLAEFSEALAEPTDRRSPMSADTQPTTEPATEPATGSPPPPAAATLQELRAACPGADSEFLLAQLEASATVSAAQTAWMTRQQELLAERTAQLEQAQKAPAEPDAVGTWQGEGGNGSAIEAFESRLRELLAAGHTRMRAVAKINKEQPELVAAYRTEWDETYPLREGAAR